MIIVVLLNLWLILAESDILSDHADGLGSDVQERGYVLQVKMLNYAGIGGGFKGKCKKISLNGGLVEATGGENYSAIGGGTEEECFCGEIKIYGGDISCYAGKNCKYALGYGTEETNEKFNFTIYPYIKRLFMKSEDQNAKIAHDLINRVVPRFEDIDLIKLMDFLAFFNTSLDDDVDEVKHGFRFIVGYKAACIIPQADVKTIK